MNKEFLSIILKRFGKGLLSVIAAYSAQFLLTQIPLLMQYLPSVIHSPVLVMALSALILALEKYLQGYRSQ